MDLKEIAEILRDTASPDLLFKKADETRREYCGDEIHVRGLIEFSNHCVRNCFYCGLRAKNPGVRRYRLTAEEIAGAAGSAARMGMRTVVLQSGEDPWFTAERLCAVIRAVKAASGAAVTLSVGERTKEEYESFRAAGADRFLLRFETSDAKLFSMLRPGASLSGRLKCLEWLKASGFQTGSGVMVGLPGQSCESLAKDLLLFRDLELDMIGVGPFIPHPDTPLGAAPGGSLELTLKVVALARLLTLNAHIPATTAMGSIDPQGRQKALRCGANVIMPNVGPLEYRKDYSIYPDKICTSDSAEKCAGCVASMISGLGRTRAEGFGHSLKKKGEQDHADNA